MIRVARLEGDRLRVAGIAWVILWVLVGPAAALDAREPATGGAAKTSSTKRPAKAAESWYVQARVTADFGIVSTHYWSKGALFRAETMLAGHPVITIVNGPRYYIYDAVLGKGAAIERNATAIGEDAGRGRPFGRELDDLIAAGGEKVSDGSLQEAAAAYQIYQLTNVNGRRRVLVTTSDPPLPFRIETFVRTTGKEGTLEYSGWQRGLDIRDSFFEPPDSIRFERVTYDDYTRRAGKQPIGPAPVYYRDLLHGERKESR